MAYSFIDYTNLTSAQQAGTFTPTTLEYVEVDDIYVSVTIALTGVATILTPSQFTVTTSPSLVVQITDPAFVGLDVLDRVRIGRTTEIDNLARTFTDGSVLKASDLNTQNNQFLFAIQEALDTGSSSLPIGPDNKYDAGGRAIKNVGSPSNAYDVATLEYVNNVLTYGTGATLPQAWYFTSGPLTNSGADRTYTLQSPTPATDVANMFLVEVRGVLQRPATDYTVTENNGVYTLRLFGAAQGQQNTGFADGTPVTVRNFGASRNVLATPFKAADISKVSLEIERLPSQTGDLINARSENNGPVLFRVSAAGAILIGAGASTETTTTYINSNQIEVGDVNESDWQKYGFLAANTAGKAKVEIQGSNPAATDIALQVFNGTSSGSVTTPFKVTYGGAITALGLLTAPSISTTSIFCAGAVNVQGGNIDVNNAYAIRVGTNEMNITRDTISGVDKVFMTPWNDAASTDGDQGIQVSNVPGAILMNTSGQTFIGFGGSGADNGVPVPHGGPGSLLFTYTPSGTSRYGPTLHWTRGAINVRGYKVPTGQGGESGQTGTSPAYINYAQQDAQDVPLELLQPGDVPCKKQIIGGVPAGFGMWFPDWSATGLAGSQWHNIDISRNAVDYDPGAEWAYRSNGGPNLDQDGIYVVSGQWMLRARGRIDARPTSANTSYSISNFNIKLQQGNRTAYQHIYELFLDYNTTNYPSYTRADFDLTILLVAATDTVTDIGSLFVRAAAPAGTNVDFILRNCCITLQKVGP